MKKYILAIPVFAMLASCATEPSNGIRRTQIRSCPIGMVLICETGRDQELSQGGDEEIPEYDTCYCESIQ